MDYDRARALQGLVRASAQGAIQKGLQESTLEILFHDFYLSQVPDDLWDTEEARILAGVVVGGAIRAVGQDRTSMMARCAIGGTLRALFRTHEDGEDGIKNVVRCAQQACIDQGMALSDTIDLARGVCLRLAEELGDGPGIVLRNLVQDVWPEREKQKDDDTKVYILFPEEECGVEDPRTSVVPKRLCLTGNTCDLFLGEVEEYG